MGIELQLSKRIYLRWHKYAKYFAISNSVKIEIAHSTAPVNLY